MAKRRPSGDGMVRKREDGRWEGRIVIGHKENGDPIFRYLYAETQKELTAKLRQIHTLIGGDILPELGSQFFLGVGVDVAEDGIAVLLVADDDATLPAAILPLADHSVTGRSSLCHVLFHLRGFYL